MRKSISYRKILLFVLLCGAFKANAQIVNTGQDIFIDNQGLFYVETTYDHSDGNILDNGVFQINGNLTNTSATSNVFAAQSTGVVNLSGATQIIGGSSKTSFPNLVLEGTGSATLGFNAEVFGTLNLKSKEFKADKYNLTITNPLATAISRLTGFVSTDSKGKLIRVSNTSSAYLFPVGSSKGTSVYRPLDITPVNTSANSFAVTFYNSDPNDQKFDRNNKRLQIQTVFDKYFYVVSEESGTTDANVKFYQSATEGEYKQTVKYNSSQLWELAPLSTLVDGSFGDQLNRTLAAFYTYSSDKLKASVPYSFAITSNLTDQFTFYNGISPNNDQKNDTWIVDGLDLFTDNELTIFNRWGDEVFKKKNYSSVNAWDGGNLNQGTYFYVLKVNDVNGAAKVYKGYITLIKE
ncbi:MAG: C-terminal target protein [Daejeonella sp.]|nr:C-terminal target protein [Daejeonella sp.]